MVDAHNPYFVGVLLVYVVLVLSVEVLRYLNPELVAELNWPQLIEPPSTPATPTTPTNFKRCSVCQKPKGEDDFSKKQWKARQVRRCIACATPAAAGPTPDQTDLVERLRLAASQRSSLDAEAEDEARRRRLRRPHRRAIQKILTPREAERGRFRHHRRYPFF